jgi:uncharacterized protein (UPF0332 family)
MAEAKTHRARAAELRSQAERIKPETAPDALISLSYYAIYHAAVAALLTAHSTAPGKHGKIHRALAKLAETREGEACAREIETAIENAYEMRIRADYEPDARPEETRANAERISALRDTVIAFCDRVIDGTRGV